MNTGRITILATVAIIACAPKGPPEVARQVLSQAMPALDGAHVQVTLVEVQYAPGGGSAPHSHTCPVIGYVLEGALRTQVQQGAAHVYQAGESFYEAANLVHLVSANASDRAPVRFLAAFICDHPPPLTLPAPSSSRVSP